MTTSPSVKIDSTESVGELNKQISPINLDTSNNDTTTTTTTTSLPKTLRNLENNQKKHRHPFSHKNLNQKDKMIIKEHCIMM